MLVDHLQLQIRILAMVGANFRLFRRESRAQMGCSVVHAIGAGRRLRTSADPPLLLMQKRLHGTRGEPTFRDRAWDRDRVRRLWDRVRAQIPALAADQAPGPRGMSAHTTNTAVTATATEADTGASTAGPLPSI